jgi:hypothetical protein
MCWSPEIVPEIPPWRVRKENYKQNQQDQDDAGKESQKEPGGKNNSDYSFLHQFAVHRTNSFQPEQGEIVAPCSYLLVDKNTNLTDQ